MVFSVKFEDSIPNLEVALKNNKHRGATDELRIAVNDIALQAIRQNQQALGKSVNFPKIYVDGVEKRARLSADDVKEDSVIELVFDVLVNLEFVAWISDQLERHSPVGRSGRYAKSHVVLANGRILTQGEDPPVDATEFVFVNNAPYARKIERGISPQAPHGVYQVVAVLARRRFADQASSLSFSYESYRPPQATGGRDDRNPAIVVRLRSRALKKI
jgi:hypothetical protein